MNSKNYFNEVAVNWDEMRKSFFPDSLKDKIIDKATLKSNETVVDLGCGSGFLSDAMKNNNVNIIAIDQSEKMIEIVKNKFFQFNNITAKIGTSDSIPLPDHSVNKVVANMYIHHIEEPLVAFKEIYRILKSGGKFVFGDLDEHNHQFLRTEQNDVWLGFNRTDIEKWLMQAGFKNIVIDCADSNCCSKSNTSTDEADISIFIASAEK